MEKKAFHTKDVRKTEMTEERGRKSEMKWGNIELPKGKRKGTVRYGGDYIEVTALTTTVVNFVPQHQDLSIVCRACHIRYPYFDPKRYLMTKRHTLSASTRPSFSTSPEFNPVQFSAIPFTVFLIPSKKMRRQYLELDLPPACIWVHCSIITLRFRAISY